MLDYMALLSEVVKKVTIPMCFSKEVNLRSAYMNNMNAYNRLLSEYADSSEDSAFFSCCSEIKRIYEIIRDAWRTYLTGNVESANSKIRNLLTRKIMAHDVENRRYIDLFLVEFGTSGQSDKATEIQNEMRSLFRCRQKRKANEDISHETIFHIAYNKRWLVNAERYSIQGFPILYLGNDPEACVQEISDSPTPDKNSIFISQYEIKADSSLLLFDLSVTPEDMLHACKRKELHSGDINRMILEYLYKVPLIVSCYYYLDGNSDVVKFHNEYVVPQMLTYAIRFRSEKSKNYNACCIRYRSVRSGERAINYAVFPTNISTREIYSKYLNEIIRWTVPVPFLEFRKDEQNAKEKFQIIIAGTSVF